MDPRNLARDVWIIDRARSGATRFTFDTSDDQSPVWSPDGRTIAFASFRANSPRFFTKPADGSGTEELLSQIENVGAGNLCDWSRDGKWLLYPMPASVTGGNSLWLLSLASGAQPKVFLENTAVEACGCFSLDAKWVAYVSDESGTNQVYVQSLAGGGKRQISVNGGTAPAWSNAGEIFFRALDGAIMSVRISTGVSVEAGTPRKLFEAPSSGVVTGTGQFAVTRDGQRFLVLSQMTESSSDPLTVVLNWTAGLKR